MWGLRASGGERGLGDATAVTRGILGGHRPECVQDGWHQVLLGDLLLRRRAKRAVEGDPDATGRRVRVLDPPGVVPKEMGEDGILELLAQALDVDVERATVRVVQHLQLVVLAFVAQDTGCKGTAGHTRPQSS